MNSWKYIPDENSVDWEDDEKDPLADWEDFWDAMPLPEEEMDCQDCKMYNRGMCKKHGTPGESTGGKWTRPWACIRGYPIDPEELRKTHNAVLRPAIPRSTERYEKTKHKIGRETNYAFYLRTRDWFRDPTQ